MNKFLNFSVIALPSNPSVPETPSLIEPFQDNSVIALPSYPSVPKTPSLIEPFQDNKKLMEKFEPGYLEEKLHFSIVSALKQKNVPGLVFKGFNPYKIITVEMDKAKEVRRSSLNQVIIFFQGSFGVFINALTIILKYL